MKPQNDNTDLQARLVEDLRLIRRYSGRSLRVFVKVRGQDNYRQNPLIDRLEAAAERLRAAGWITGTLRMQDSPN